MADKKRSIVLMGMCAVLGLILLLFVLTVPIDLSVKVLPDKIYAGQQLDEKDFEIKTKTLFGVKHKVSGCSIYPSDGNMTVLVMYRNLQKEIHIDVIKAISLDASYDGSVYVGQTADSKKASMKAEYEDGGKGVGKSDCCF